MSVYGSFADGPRYSRASARSTMLFVAKNRAPPPMCSGKCVESPSASDVECHMPKPMPTNGVMRAGYCKMPCAPSRKIVTESPVFAVDSSVTEPSPSIPKFGWRKYA